MRFIITGALGHIGSKLLRELPKEFNNCKIILIDNLCTQRFCSLFNLPKNGNYEFIEGDILKINLKKIIQNNDIIIHLAAITDAASSFGRQKEIRANNLVSTRKIVQAVSSCRARLIFVSSTSIYGPQAHEVDETCADRDLKPQSPYAQIKLLEEQLIKKKKNLRFIIFRFGTIVGVSPGMRFHTAVNKFCFDAFKKKPITVWSKSYNEVRPYLGLKDAIRALTFSIKNKIFDQNVYNILSGNFSVKYILKLIKKHKSKLTIRFTNSPYLNQMSYKVLNKKIAKLGLRFDPNSVENEIKDILQMLRICKKIK